MTLAILDRYLLRRCAAGALALTVLVSALILGLDLLLRLADLTEGKLGPEQSRLGLLLRHLAYRAPMVISPLLPVAAVGGALIALVPMLRRGELTALAASGISLRRACRGAFLLAAVLGCVDLVVSDQLAPRLQGPAAQVEQQLTGRPDHGRIWRVETTGSTWFAGRIWLREGRNHARQLAVASSDGRLITAGGLDYEDPGGWVLRDVVEEGRTGVRHHEHLAATGWLALPYSPADLSQLLASRYALTSPELWRQGGQLNRSLALQRWLRLLVPLLCVACALPIFVHFENRERLIQGTGQALVAALVPVALIGLGAAAADASDAPPILVMGIAGALAAAPGVWLVLRWRN